MRTDLSDLSEAEVERRREERAAANRAKSVRKAKMDKVFKKKITKTNRQK